LVLLGLVVERTQNAVAAVFLPDSNGDWVEKTDCDAVDRDLRSYCTQTTSNMYLSDLSELASYQAKTHRNYGLLVWNDGLPVFFRLDPELVVLGEHHNANKTVLDLVGEARGWKFMHEGFVEPLSSSDSNTNAKEVNKAVLNLHTARRRLKHLDGSHLHAFPQAAEDLLPKLWRAGGMILDNLRLGGKVDETVDRYYLTWLRLYAVGIAGTERKELKTLAESDAVVEIIAELNKVEKDRFRYTDMSELPGNATAKTLALRHFLAHFSKFAKQTLDSQYPLEPQKQRTLLEKHRKSINRVKSLAGSEFYRDASMLSHIFRAKENGYLVFGMGSLHLRRLKPILKILGIKAQTTEEFVEEMRGRYPQPAGVEGKREKRGGSLRRFLELRDMGILDGG
jgi:hypothetical protein